MRWSSKVGVMQISLGGRRASGAAGGHARLMQTLLAAPGGQAPIDGADTLGTALGLVLGGGASFP